jgi:cell division protein FtsB
MQWLKNHLRQILVGALVVILILLMAEFNNRMTELNHLTEQRERAAFQITSLVQTQVALETQIAHATSVAAVEEWAYEEGKLVRPGDNPIVPLAEGATGKPTPVPVVPINSDEVVENWEVWYALFFDVKETP